MTLWGTSLIGVTSHRVKFEKELRAYCGRSLVAIDGKRGLPPCWHCEKAYEREKQSFQT